MIMLGIVTIRRCIDVGADADAGRGRTGSGI